MTRVRGLLVAVLTLASYDTAAASCVAVVPKPPACYWLAMNPVAFLGRVVDVTRTPVEVAPGAFTTRILTRFVVLESFAGEPGMVLDVLGTDSSLDVEFQQDEEYIVFGTDRPGRGFTVGTCAGTTAVEDAAPSLLAELRALKNVRGPGAVARGRITLDWPRLPGVIAGSPAPSFEGIPVSVRSSSHSASAVSRADGSFEITGLPVDDYYIEMEAPSGMYRVKYMDYPDFVVRSTNGCVTTHLTLQYDGRILGRLVNRAGRALAGVRVKAMAADPDEPFGMGEGHTSTDETGAFEIAHLDPGRYVVGVDGTSMYAPGVDSRGSAIEVDVAPGARVELDEEFRAPTDLAPVSLTGIVLDEAGVPVSSATVFATGGLGTRDEAATGDDGRFRLTVLAAGTYAARVEHVRLTAPYLREARASVSHSERPREFTLVIRAPRR